jgi:hypothetical protein
MEAGNTEKYLQAAAISASEADNSVRRIVLPI